MADYRVLVIGPSGSYIEAKAPDRVVIDNLVTSQLVVPAGNSFPPAPDDNEVFWRTDSQELFKWEAGTATWRPAVTTDNVLQRYGLAYGDPTGFQNVGESDLTWDHGTATLTISPTGPSFSFYVGGNKFTKNAPESVTISLPGHAYYSFAYDPNGDLVQCSTPFPMDGNFCPIAVVTYDTTAGTRSFMADHRGSYENTLMARALGNRGENLRVVRGFTIGDYVLNTDNDAAIQFSLTGGAMSLLDIVHNVVDFDPPSIPYEQALSKPAQLAIVYRIGSDWTWDAPGPFFCRGGVGSGRTVYNLDTAGVWSLAEPPDDSYIPYWIILTNNTSSPIISVIGQTYYSDLAVAKSDATIDKLWLWERFPATCYKVLYRVMVQTGNGYGGNRKAKIQDVADYRGAYRDEHFPLHSDRQSLPIDHAALKHTDAAASHPAESISVKTGKFDVLLGANDTDVQEALETLDNHHHHAEPVAHEYVNLMGKSIYTVEAGFFGLSGCNYFRNQHMGTWDDLYRHCYWQVRPDSTGVWSTPQHFASTGAFFTWLEQTVPTNPSEEYTTNAQMRAFELVDDRDPFPSRLIHRNSMITSMMGRRMWVRKRDINTPVHAPKPYGVSLGFYSWYATWFNTLGLRLVNHATGTVPPTNNDDVVWYSRGSKSLWNWPQSGGSGWGHSVEVGVGSRGAAWNVTTQAWVTPAPAGFYNFGTPFVLVEWNRAKGLALEDIGSSYERNMALRSVCCLVFPVTCVIGLDTYLAFVVYPHGCDNFFTDYVDPATHDLAMVKHYPHSYNKTYCTAHRYIWAPNEETTCWGLFTPGGVASTSLLFYPRETPGGAYINMDTNIIPREVLIAKRDRTTGIRSPWRSVLKIRHRIPHATYRVDPSPKWNRI